MEIVRRRLLNHWSTNDAVDRVASVADEAMLVQETEHRRWMSLDRSLCWVTKQIGKSKPNRSNQTVDGYVRWIPAHRRRLTVDFVLGILWTSSFHEQQAKIAELERLGLWSRADLTCCLSRSWLTRWQRATHRIDYRRARAFPFCRFVSTRWVFTSACRFFLFSDVEFSFALSTKSILFHRSSRNRNTLDASSRQRLLQSTSAIVCDRINNETIIGGFIFLAGIACAFYCLIYQVNDWNNTEILNTEKVQNSKISYLSSIYNAGIFFLCKIPLRTLSSLAREMYKNHSSQSASESFHCEDPPRASV